MNPDSTVARPTAIAPSVVFAVIITLLAWASAFVVIRGAGHYFSGGSLALARLLVGAILLRAALFRRRWVKPTAREWGLVLTYGLAWFGVYNVSLNLAEQTLDAGTTAMIVNIGPILIALGAGVFLGEKISRWLAIGSAIAFSGVVLISLGAGAIHLSQARGIVLSLLAAFAYTSGVLCQKVVLRRLPAAQVTWLGCMCGAVACLPFLGQLISDLRSAPSSAILGAIYLGAVPTAVAFSAWSFALSKLPAAQLGVTTYIVPALVVLLGFLCFHEIPSTLAILGGVVCLTGVALSRKRVN